MPVLSPMDPMVLAASLEVFKKVAMLVSTLVACAFIFRLIMLQVSFAPASDYAETVKDTVSFFALVAAFPMLVKILMDACAALANSISYLPPSDAQIEVENMIKSVFGGETFLWIVAKFLDFILVQMAGGFYTLCLAITLGAAPIIIFMNTILGLSTGLRPFFTTLISFSLYPVLWNIIGLLGKQVWPYMKSQPMSASIFWVTVQILQLFSPFFCSALFSKGSLQKTIEKNAQRLS